MRDANSDLNEEPQRAAGLSEAGNVKRDGGAAAGRVCAAVGPSISAMSATGAVLRETVTRKAANTIDGMMDCRPEARFTSLRTDVTPRNAAAAAGCSKPAGVRVNASTNGSSAPEASVNLGQIPERVRASGVLERAEYDARRLRSQREVIRDVMLSAANCETWLTLGELRALTRYGEASISAQLRHLRKTENGGYEIAKRQREGAAPPRPGTGGRAEWVWEYRISPAACAQDAAKADAQQAAVTA
jgi:hypothetical protein